MANITKQSVLDSFTTNYNAHPEMEDRRRALAAHFMALDDLAPQSATPTPQEIQDADVVMGFLIEILSEDYGIELRKPAPYTAMELTGMGEGQTSGQAFIQATPQAVPAFPTSEASAYQWTKDAKVLALAAAPQGQMGDPEWADGFVTGFTGALWEYVQAASLETA